MGCSLLLYCIAAKAQIILNTKEEFIMLLQNDQAIDVLQDTECKLAWSGTSEHDSAK